MQKNRILFVDDEAILLNALKRMLSRHNRDWEMSFISDPAEALDEFTRTPFDVVVSDMKMPNLNGLALAKRLREIDRDVQIIILSGAADLSDAVEAINDGNVLRFYTKPSATYLLSEGIKAALDEREHRINSRASAARHALAQPSVGEAALNRLPVGVVVIDQRGNVVFMNPLGAEFVAARDGLTVDQFGILRASNPDDTAALHNLVQVLIDQGIEAEAQAISLERPSMARPYAVRAEPVGDLGSDNDGAEKLVILFLTDPEKPPRISLEILSQLFGLTDSESRLAVQIATGATLDEAAASLDLTISTVRTYLKQVFSKTGTNRQAELVKLILMSSAAG